MLIRLAIVRCGMVFQPSLINAFIVQQRFYCKDKFIGVMTKAQLYQFYRDMETNCQTVSVSALSDIPLACRRHRCEFDFLVRFIKRWWNLTERKFDVMNEQQLVSILYSLSKINRFENSVVNILTRPRLEKLCEYALSAAIISPNAKSLSILCRSIKYLADSMGEDQLVFQKNIAPKLRAMLYEVFAQESFKRKRGTRENIGPIILNSVALGVEQLEDPAQKNIIHICLDAFELRCNHEMDSEPVLSGVFKAGLGISLWNFNPGELFWAKYLQSIKENFRPAQRTKQRFHTNVLKQVFLICLPICEKEFVKPNFLTFWQTQMMAVDAGEKKKFSFEQHLHTNEINQILDLCVKKYDGNVEKIASVLSPELFDTIRKRTDVFEIKVVEGVKKLIHIHPATLTDFTSPKASRKPTYDALCHRIVSNEDTQTLSCAVLCFLPSDAVKYRDEKRFVEDVFEPWWLLTESRLNDRDVAPYQLTHSLYAFMQLNSATNGLLVDKMQMLEKNPIERLVILVITDVKHEYFTNETFSVLLTCVLKFEKHFPDLRARLNEDINRGFNNFFDQKFFEKKSYKDTYHDSIGDLIEQCQRVAIAKPSDDVLKVIVECCAKSFTYSRKKLHNLYHLHLWDLAKMMTAFTRWKVDPDKHHSRFWQKCFKTVVDDYELLNKNDSNFLLLRSYVLERLILVTLTLDKEEEFQTIKKFWQSEVSSFRLPVLSVRTILSTAVDCHKRGQLEDLLSKRIYEEFIKIMKNS